MMKRFMLLVFILAFAASCSKGGGMKEDYVLKIDGKKLTQGDVQAEIATLPSVTRQMFQGPEGMKRFIDEMAKKESLYLEARKRGFENDKVVQKRIEDATKGILINYLLKKEMESAAKLNEKDLKDYYNSHKDEFTNKREVRVSRIVVKTQDEARKVYEQLKNGEDFAKLAAKVSLDKSSAKSGGDIGFVHNMIKGRLEDSLMPVVFNLKKGEPGMPVAGKEGFNILKVTDVKGTPIDFKDVKDQLTAKLTMERQKATYDKLMETLKKSYKVEINKDALAKLGPMPPPAGGANTQLPMGHPQISSHK